MISSELRYCVVSHFNDFTLVIAVIPATWLESPCQPKPVIIKILKSVGEATEPSVISATCGPPNRDDYSQAMPNDDVGEQSIPEYEFN